MQVKPLAEPQVASGDVAVAVATTALEVRLPEAEDREKVEAHAGGENDEVEATRFVGVRYQLACGSPRHSPIVTPT